jgi:hypothetical protein
MENAELQNFFEEPSTPGGERWVILSDLTQQLPQYVTVTGAEKRKDKKGGELKVLLLQDADGKRYVMSAWLRDVAACVKEWGKNPMLWERCEFIAKNGRWTLNPTTNNHTNEVIGN